MLGFKSIDKVTPGEVSDRFFMGQLTLVDVRSEEEFEEVRVPGVLHIPVTEIKGRLAEIPVGHPVAFLCRSGHRSSLAARMAARRGSPARWPRAHSVSAARSARTSTVAARRSSGPSRALRLLIASPSASRTIGQTTTSRGKARSRTIWRMTATCWASFCPK